MRATQVILIVTMVVLGFMIIHSIKDCELRIHAQRGKQLDQHRQLKGYSKSYND